MDTNPPQRVAMARNTRRLAKGSYFLMPKTSGRADSSVSPELDRARKM